MSGFLIDTNVISELVKPKPHPHVVRWMNDVDEDTLFLSVLTLGEIRKGIALLPQSHRKSHLGTWLEKDLPERFLGRVLPLTDRIADRWGLIAARTQSLKKPVHVIDSLMAATALDHNLIFVTRNTRDLEPTGVPLQNPWE
ncbi:MAG: type II toxin-antitoxin system VapC family toxin [Elusimicrobia bacterium]|jgi:predicted nucleic acid-binding protein|nr:type II toxin-antitoxin system VapC family toxin [Elusimicrobiota bacterium]